jgi:hypothetical protein
MLLSRDGHSVTVLERGPAEPPSGPADRAWNEWQRSGVNQFRLPHYMLPRWWAELRELVPDMVPMLVAAGAGRFNPVTAPPAAMRGEVRPDDDRWHRLAEVEGDIAGRPYRPDDPRWLGGKALLAAALQDPHVARAHVTLSSLLVTPDEVFATPGLRDRAMALGRSAPQYPMPELTRAELLGVLATASGSDGR